MQKCTKPLAMCFLFANFLVDAAFAAPCAVPNTISNGQVADASKVMEDFNAIAQCAGKAVQRTGSQTTGSIAVFSGSDTIASGNLTGDVTTAGGTTTTLSNTGVVSGTYSNPQITVDSKGRVLSATNGAPGSAGGSAWWFRPPVSSDFSVNMMDRLTMTMVNDLDVGLRLSITPTSGVSGLDSGQYMGKPIGNPSANWEVITRLEFNTRSAGDFTRWGLALANSTKSKRIVFGWDSRAVVYIGYFFNPAGYGGAQLRTDWGGGGYPRWWRITHDTASSTLGFYVSQDGKGWTLINTISDSGWLGETPKFIGVGFDIPNAAPGFDLPLSIAYWRQSW